jgi:acrylyl-CoA reductase (NADPH)
LRGISLIGIDSAESDIDFKKQIWSLFSENWSLNLDDYSKVVKLADIENEIKAILNGEQIGRVVIKHGDL